MNLSNLRGTLAVMHPTYCVIMAGRYKQIRVSRAIVIEGDIRKRRKRKRQKYYDEKVFEVLKKIWLIMDCICGKRLAPALKEVVLKLQKHKEIAIDKGIRQKLFKISPATIDRMLSGPRKKLNIKGRSLTKPGTLLKNQIPIRTFSEWDEKRPGFIEIDLVGHDGGDAGGEFIQTLDVTDVCSGWTETQAVRNKAQVWVFEALGGIKKRLPFPLLGIDSDNGSEFINHHLLRFCKEGKITFTRSRSYRKNDSCFVEQKNYSIVRRSVGYYRYDTEEELKTINELYGYLRLYTNFFQPVMKLIEKTRIGSKVQKKYDRA
ncbi:MAG: DDE-type integrase/transposase/recombinase [Thermodesulfovibrionales bacterium]